MLAGGPGQGKSSLSNAVYEASKVSRDDYALAAAEAAATGGEAWRETTVFVPSPQDRYRCAPPRLTLDDVHVGAEVEMHYSLDSDWAPGAQRQRLRATCSAHPWRAQPAW